MEKILFFFYRVHVFESQKFKLNHDTIVSIGTGILSGVVKNNPEIIEKIPPGALNGIVSAMATANKKDNREDSKSGASFSKRSDPKEVEENEEEEEEDDTQIKIAFLEQMQEKLDDDELEKMFGMMQYLMDNPSLINTAYGLMISNGKQAA